MKGTFAFSTRLCCSGILGVTALSAPVSVAAQSPTDYVAHEWGTFTSVHNWNGELMEWTPLESSDLPGFVYDWSRPGINSRPVAGVVPSKGRLRTLQRMETPVIYFYSDREQEVGVSVRFPQGLITEWYPQPSRIGPSRVLAGPFVQRLDSYAPLAGSNAGFTFAGLMPAGAGTEDSCLVWDRVRIMPREQCSQLEKHLLQGPSRSHYFRARDTDANYLRVDTAQTIGQGSEVEKFLFYRGVGNFGTPLQTRMSSDSALTVANAGKDLLSHLYVLSIDNGEGWFVPISRVEAGAQCHISLDSGKPRLARSELSAKLCHEVARALEQEGLYAREAEAMVETWRESWFEEDGLRVLYVLPRAWTDRVLPLSLKPSPGELVRVMVGRAEVLRKQTKQQLEARIIKAAEGDCLARAEAIDHLRNLGRFAEPALEVATRAAKQDVREEAWRLLQQAR